jgi:hypothetical protein
LKRTVLLELLNAEGNENAEAAPMGRRRIDRRFFYGLLNPPLSGQP